MNKIELINKIDEWIKAKRGNYVKDVISAVNIPSISGGA